MLSTSFSCRFVPLVVMLDVDLPISNVSLRQKIPPLPPSCHESDGLRTLNSARKQQINALTQQQVQELTAQHRTTAEQNRTKPKTSYDQIHNILTHTYRQLQAITTNTYTQSANTTESQPAQKGQFITKVC